MRTPKRLMMLALLTWLTLAPSGAARGQYLKLSLEEVAQNADLIFVGTVRGQASRADYAHGMVLTDVFFKDIGLVHAAEKSRQRSASEIRLTYAGGTASGLSVEVSHAPSFLEGRRYLIFMLDDGFTYASPIIGGGQGLYEVMTDPASGEEYVRSVGGRAVMGVGADGVVLSPGRVAGVNAGAFVEERADSATPRAARMNEAATPADLRDSASPSDAGPGLAAPGRAPLRLRDFLDFITGTALKKQIENNLLKKEGRGVFYRRSGGEMKAEPLDLVDPESVAPRPAGVKPSAHPPAAAGQSDSLVAAAGGTVGACGYFTTPIVMEQVPTSFWSYSIVNDNLYTWNQFMDIFRVQASDGTWGDNSTNEFGGFADSDTLDRIYGYRWALGALAVTISKKGFFEPTCGKFSQSDVLWNAGMSWTSDAEFALGNSGVVLLRPVNMHETGHVWGLQSGTYAETYDYDVATVMQPYYSRVVEDGWGIHSTDAYIIRRHYQNQALLLGTKDVGVESYYASNGLNNSTTNASSYTPGQSITLYNVTVENMSYAAVSDVRVRFYLSTNRTITTADYQLGSYWYWTSFGGETYNVGNYTTTIPSTIPAGQYYVGALVTMNGFNSDDYTYNNSTSFYSSITVGQTITVGQGAPSPQLFVDAYNRNSLSQYVLMPPLNAVHRWDCSTCSTANSTWGKGLIQDFDGNDGVSHHALMRADTNTNFVALIYGGMWTKFLALGGLNYDSASTRMLGYPIADRNCSDYNAACFTDAQLVSPFNTSYHYQRFQGGALVLHKSGARINQTYEVHGAIRTRWQDLGGPGGSYGLPVGDEYAWQSKRRSDFEGGSICFNPATNQTEPGCTTPPAQVSVTFQTSPAGRSYTVDGVTYSGIL